LNWRLSVISCQFSVSRFHFLRREDHIRLTLNCLSCKAFVLRIPQIVEVVRNQFARTTPSQFVESAPYPHCHLRQQPSAIFIPTDEQERRIELTAPYIPSRAKVLLAG
jgi:hypothetical protein